MSFQHSCCIGNSIFKIGFFRDRLGSFSFEAFSKKYISIFNDYLGTKLKLERKRKKERKRERKKERTQAEKKFESIFFLMLNDILIYQKDLMTFN